MLAGPQRGSAAQDLLFSTLVVGKRPGPDGVVTLDGPVTNELPSVAVELAREYGVREPGQQWTSRTPARAGGIG